MSIDPFTPSHKSDYAWDVSSPIPSRDDWTEEEYLKLTDHSNQRIEYNEGRLEYLPMPTEIHEALVHFLLFALHRFVEERQLGKVYSNGIRIKVLPRKHRLPDVLFLHKDHFHLRHNRVWDGIDLAMEVVSDDPKDRSRDYDEKFIEYAKAGIAEYWIVDPERRVVIVHQLQEGKYAVHGEFIEGTEATSVLLPGFSIDVNGLFAEIEGIPD